MQVLLNTDPHTDGRVQMAHHLETVVLEALDRFREHVTRVEAHIADTHVAARTDGDRVRCTLEARLAGMDPVVVKDQAGTAHQAIDGALGKLKRALATRLERHEARRHTALEPTAPEPPPAG